MRISTKQRAALKQLRAEIEGATSRHDQLVVRLDWSTAAELVELALAVAKDAGPPAPPKFCQAIENARGEQFAGSYLAAVLQALEQVEAGMKASGLLCTARGSREFVEAVAEFRRRLIDRGPGGAGLAVHTQRWPQPLHHALGAIAAERNLSLNQLVALTMAEQLISPACAWRPAHWQTSSETSSSSTSKTPPASSGA